MEIKIFIRGTKENFALSINFEINRYTEQRLVVLVDSLPLILLGLKQILPNESQVIPITIGSLTRVLLIILLLISRISLCNKYPSSYSSTNKVLIPSFVTKVNLSFRNSFSTYNKPLQVIYSDIYGPALVTSFINFWYYSFLLIILQSTIGYII